MNPSLTKEDAIDYLHKIGWMQDHDRQMTEMAEPKYWIDYNGHVTPIVQPSRRKGHWIKEVDFGNCVHYVCSECKNEGEKDYCPNCGADMRGDTE